MPNVVTISPPRSPSTERLLRAYPSLGYEVITLPKVEVGTRADFILQMLAE